MTSQFAVALAADGTQSIFEGMFPPRQSQTLGFGRTAPPNVN